MDAGVIGGIIGLIAAGVGLYVAYRVSFGALLVSKPPAGAKVQKQYVLRKDFRKLNRNNPFTISESKEQGIDLHVKWTVANAKWLEVFGKGWHNLSYTGDLVFDETNHIVKYSEQVLRKDRSVGPFFLRFNTSFVRGMIINRRIKRYQFGIRTDGSIGEVVKYDFSPAQIKGVLRQIANRNGWTFAVYTFKKKLLQ